MKQLFFLSILITFILLMGCEKDRGNDYSANFQYEAIVIDKGIDCGETFIISLKSRDTEYDIKDGIYYADYLDLKFKVPRMKIYLNCRELSNEELYPCTEMGITYPHVIVINSKISQ